MAAIENIIVGAAKVWISKTDSTQTGGQPQNMPSFGASGSANDYLANTGATNWRDVGFTSEGFEISYEPQYGEVEVDQLLDSARIFKTQLRVMLRTSMNEGTLENVRIAFGQGSATQTSSVYDSSSTQAAATGYGAEAGQNVLGLAAGALAEPPVERSLIAVGPAPTQSGKSTERVYLARRVLSMETVSHALRRNESTVYPVTFRCLPANGYANAEYGEILDRVWT